MKNLNYNYFACGWFTPQQNEVYDKVCKVMKETGLYDDFFIPRDQGINLTTMSPEERMKQLSRVFALDTGMILYSFKNKGFMLAVIDDYDTGVIWEVGAAWGLSLGQYPVVSYSDKGYGLNVMFRESVCGHIKGTGRLFNFLNSVKTHGEDKVFDIARNYQDFSAEVY